MHSLYRFMATASLAALLAACGGGGSSGGGAGSSGGGAGGSNSPPTFTSPTSSSFLENDLVSFTLTFSDPDGDAVTVTDESGGDGALFTVDTSNGRVTGGPFDFEAPQDTNGDNIYEQVIRLSDGRNSTTETIQITITNVDEPVTCSTGEVISLNEGETGVVYTFVGVDEEGEEGRFDEGLTFSTEPSVNFDADMLRDVFSVDPVTGELSLSRALDAEEIRTDVTYVLRTTFGFVGDQAGCAVRINLVDVEGSVESGAVLKGSQIGTNAIGDLDGDGLSELWVYDAVQDGDTSSGFFVRGSSIQQSFPLNGGDGTLDFSNLSASELSVRIFAQFPGGETNSDDDQGELLLGRSISDLDGDGVRELLIGVRPDFQSSSIPSTLDRPVGYVLWGQSLLDDSDGEIDLTTLTSDQGLEISVSDDPEKMSDRSNLSLVAADFDGDGLDDVTFGLSEFDVFGDGVGAPTYIVFGDTLQAAKPSGKLLIDENDEVLKITSPNGSRFDRASFSVSSLNDLDGDGAPELVAGGLFDNVYILFSSAIKRASTTENAFWSGFSGDGGLQENPFSGQRPNLTLVSDFDFDGDNRADLLFGTNDQVRLVPGALISGDNSELIPIQAEGEIRSVTAIGDLDGDGLDEIAVGAELSENLGRVYIFTGQRLVDSQVDGSFSLLDLERGNSVAFEGVVQSDFLGTDLTTLPDTDGDGLDELIIQSLFNDDGYIILGSDILASLQSAETIISIAEFFDNEAP